MRSKLTCTLVVVLLAGWMLITLKQPAAYNDTMIRAIPVLSTPTAVDEHELDPIAASLRSFSKIRSADYALGMIYFQQGDHQSAVDAFRQVNGRLPCDIASDFRMRGNYWACEEEFANSERGYRVAVDLSSDLVEARIALGRVLYHQGDVEQASQMLASAVTLIPENQAIHFALLGQMYGWRREWQQASDAYRQAVASAPNNGDYGASLAYAIYEAHGAEQASRYLGKQADDKPDWMWGLSLFATLLFSSGQCEQGTIQMQRAIMQGLPEANARSLQDMAAACFKTAPALSH